MRDKRCFREVQACIFHSLSTESYYSQTFKLELWPCPAQLYSLRRILKVLYFFFAVLFGHGTSPDLVAQSVSAPPH